MLFGDAHIVTTPGHGLFQGLEARAAGHGGGDAHNGIIFLAQFDHRLAENFMVIRGSAGLGRRRVAGHRIVRSQAVEFFRIIQGGFVAFAFFCQDMQHHRQFAGPGIFERADEQRQIMSIYWAKVAQPHFLKNQAVAIAAAPVGLQLLRVLLQGGSRQDAFEDLFGFVAHLDRQLSFGHSFDPSFQVLLHAVVARIGDDFVEVGGNRANVLGDAPLVVV